MVRGAVPAASKTEHNLNIRAKGLDKRVFVAQWENLDSFHAMVGVWPEAVMERVLYRYQTHFDAF